MELIHKYFKELTAVQQRQFAALEKLYTDWNQRINLISRNDLQNLYERHVLHSLSIALFLHFPKGSKILDAGTGGGFPGIPLAIMFPSCRFLLVDSMKKKIRAVRGIAASIELTNVTTRHARVEKIREEFDFIVSRAVTAFPLFYAWVHQKLRAGELNSRNGILYLAGGELSGEVSKINRKAQIIELHNYLEEPFFSTKKIIYVPVRQGH